MFGHRFIKIALTAVFAMAMCYGCAEKEFQTCTIPSVIVLEDPVLNTSTMEITVSAIYNGDDEGIKDAWFSVYELTDPENVSKVRCEYLNGKAHCQLKDLELGKNYGFNFNILTIGDNNVTAATAKECPFSNPSDFSYSTSNTNTAKILQVRYSGSDLFITESQIVIKNSNGEVMDNVPQPLCAYGCAKMLFYFNEWEEDVYTFQIKMSLYDGTTVTSPEGFLTLMPLPENIVLSPVKINEDKSFSFEASYDGEDKTVSKAEFTIMDKDGKVVETILGTCSGKKAVASTQPYEYGRYKVAVKLSLVDGTYISTEEMSFVHAKPRAFETFEMTYQEMAAAGWAINDAGCAEPTVSECKGYNWEYQYIYVRTSGGKTFLYVSSSKKGYMNNTSPFEMGIKKVYIGFNSGKNEKNFECYAKADENGEWEKMPTAVKEGTVFTFDLSGGNYKFFKFTSLAKQEMRSDYVKVEYYTEPYVEY